MLLEGKLDIQDLCCGTPPKNVSYLHGRSFRVLAKSYFQRYSRICTCLDTCLPCGLRFGSVAARFLGVWVRISPLAWVYVSCERYVLSGRGLCDGLIIRPEESSRVCCVQWMWTQSPYREAMDPESSRSTTEIKGAFVSYIYLQFQPVCDRAIDLTRICFPSRLNWGLEAEKTSTERRHLFYVKIFAGANNYVAVCQVSALLHQSRSVHWALMGALQYEYVYIYWSNPSNKGIYYFPISLITSLT
jgi:hypothetical protein